MTSFTDDLSPRQRGRAAALAIARDVLSSSQLFGKSALDGSRGIDDLLVLAEWILDDQRPVSLKEFIERATGGVVVEAKDPADLLSKIGDRLPDCGNPDCPAHGPKREAQDLDPEDAKSSFDAPVDEFQRASEVAQDELKTEQPEPVPSFDGDEIPSRPHISPYTYKLGSLYHTGTDTDTTWQAALDPDGARVWKLVPGTGPIGDAIPFINSVYTDVDGNEWVVKSDGQFGHQYWTTK